MFSTIFGLPAHPLLIHIAVVFIPLLVIAAIVYAALPVLHRRITWAVVIVAVIAPIAALFAKLSGQNLRDQRYAGQDIPLLDEHATYGTDTLWFTIALGIVTLALVGYVAASRRRDASSSRRYGQGRRGNIDRAIATVVMLALGGVTAYYVIRTGDAGARMVWG